MAKTKNENSTTAKIEELTGEKPKKVTEVQHKQIQSIVNRINNMQMNIGQIEARKHQILHMMSSVNDELTVMQKQLNDEYGTDDINIMDGTINYPKENGEANKKD
tara:strand:- start:116 stop:430 length:315 start_codon:yes stop_codon:yes gene_type:complete